MSRLVVTSTVNITVQVIPTDRWDNDATITQIHRQAVESAVSALTRVLHDGKHINARIIGVAKVQAVSVEEEKQ